MSAQASVRRWTVGEYYRLAEQGFFDGQRVELLRGEIVVMAPQTNHHAFVVQQLAEAIIAIRPDGYGSRSQAPLRLTGDTEPEPDLYVFEGSNADYTGGDHPTAAKLVVEVAVTTLAYDRTDKLAVYAAGGVDEYWVIDVPGRRVEVYRSARPDAAGGPRYADAVRLGDEDSLNPLFAPDATIKVASLLP